MSLSIRRKQQRALWGIILLVCTIWSGAYSTSRADTPVPPPEAVKRFAAARQAQDVDALLAVLRQIGQQDTKAAVIAIVYAGLSESTIAGLNVERPIIGARQWLHVLGRLDLDALMHMTRPVGSFPMGASPYGAHNMGGNLWEWCRDSYRKGYDPSASAHNPTGPPPSPYKVLRGGAWSSHRGKIRAAYRNYDLLTDRHLEIGFRCVR